RRAAARLAAVPRFARRRRQPRRRAARRRRADTRCREQLQARAELMLAEGSLADRVVLITGGGTGLGRAMALELGRLGAKVAVVGRRRHVLEETVAELADAVAVPADVREPNAVAAAFDVAEAELGPITTLVNNAAG